MIERFEQIGSQEPMPATRVLELGYGSRPALYEGTLFQDPSVHYVGVDLPKTFKGNFSKWRDYDPATNPVEADMACLPFADDSFNYVLMRSTYGQFRSFPQVISNVRLGAFEAFRVLRPGGQIVVAEENTPEDLSYVKSELKYAGFTIDESHYMPDFWENIADDDAWKTARSVFFGDQPTQPGPSRLFGTPHILFASKPLEPEYREFTTRVVTNFYNDQETKVKDITFKVGEEPSPEDIEPVDWAW